MRRLVHDVCTRWGLGSMCQDLTLVAGALTENALSDGVDDELLVVRLELRENVLSVAVRSANPRVRRPSRSPLDSAGSRGLAIVAAVCSSWGHAPTADGGKITWGVLHVPHYQRTAGGTRPSNVDI